MLNVGELLQTRSSGTGPAIIEGATGQGVAWADVAGQAERWSASGLAGPVGLALADPVAMAANFVAALRSGIVVAPLDPSAPPGEHRSRIAQLGLRAMVVGPEVAPVEGVQTWSADRRDLRLLGGDTAGGRGGNGRSLPAEPADVRAIMASSGTTGAPKIIPLTEGQLLETAAGVASHLDLDPGQRGYSPLPLFHINGLVVGVLSALVAGSTIVVDRQFSRRAFWSTVDRSGATWLNLVPAILAILAAPLDGEGPHSWPGVRLARSASAPLPAAVRDRFEQLTGIPVVETYGMTEAASQITANPTGDVRTGSVGRPVGVGLRVVDPEKRPLPAGETGQVQIRGSRVTSWYWSTDPAGAGWAGRPAVDQEGWLDTGDIGWLDPDGFLYLVGREGDVINRGGEKVQPREVEEVLLSDSRVTAAVVVGRPHPTTGEEPVAYVLATEAAVASPQELTADLRRLCESSLSRFKRPAEIFVARSLPAGPTGKVRRAAVRAMPSPAPSPPESPIADSTAHD